MCVNHKRNTTHLILVLPSFSPGCSFWFPTLWLYWVEGAQHFQPEEKRVCRSLVVTVYRSGHSSYWSITYLSVFVQDVSKESVGVGESLRACTLPHTDHSVLLRMQHTALRWLVKMLKSSVNLSWILRSCFIDTSYGFKSNISLPVCPWAQDWSQLC